MAKIAPAPNQQEMGLIESSFGKHDALLVKQTMKGCCQESMGCEAKSEFTIAGLDWGQITGYKVSDAALGQPDEMYAIEQSSFCMRLCWRDGRAFAMTVSQGGNPGGAPIVDFKKPCGFPLQCQIGDSTYPCCCLLPQIGSSTPGGSPLGYDSQYICDINCWVPKLKYSEGGQPIYVLRPETCCCGCCIACNPCSGKGLVYIPFYFHDPSSMEVIEGGYTDTSPQIRKVWAGMEKECCSTADTFAVKFPAGSSPLRKAGLLGLTFLLDFTVFERQQQKE